MRPLEGLAAATALVLAGTLLVATPARAADAPPTVQVGAPISDVALTNGGTILYATVPNSSVLRSVDVETGAVIADIDLGAQAFDLVVSPSGGTLYVNLRTRIAVVNATTGAIDRVVDPDWPEHEEGWSLLLNPDGTKLVLTVDVGGAILLDTTTFEVVDTVHTNAYSLDHTFSPDGRTVFFNEGSYGAVGSFDLETRAYRSYGRPVEAVHDLAVDPTGETLWVIPPRGPIVLLDIETAEVVGEIHLERGSNPEEFALDGQFVPGARQFVVAGYPDLLWIVDIDTGANTREALLPFVPSAIIDAPPSSALGIVAGDSVTLLRPASVERATLPPAGRAGSAYDFAIPATDAVGFTVAQGVLPSGLTLDPSTGRVTGTPTQPGSNTVQIAAAGRIGQPSIVEYTMVVSSAEHRPTFRELLHDVLQRIWGWIRSRLPGAT